MLSSIIVLSALLGFERTVATITSTTNWLKVPETVCIRALTDEYGPISAEYQLFSLDEPYGYDNRHYDSWLAIATEVDCNYQLLQNGDGWQISKGSDVETNCVLNADDPNPMDCFESDASISVTSEQCESLSVSCSGFIVVSGATAQHAACNGYFEPFGDSAFKKSLNENILDVYWYFDYSQQRWICGHNEDFNLCSSHDDNAVLEMEFGWKDIVSEATTEMASPFSTVSFDCSGSESVGIEHHKSHQKRW
jgi:hypothetical protein